MRVLAFWGGNIDDAAGLVPAKMPSDEGTCFPARAEQSPSDPMDLDHLGSTCFPARAEQSQGL